MSRWGLFCYFEDHFHFSIIFLNFGFGDPKSLSNIPISQERFRVGAFAGGSAAELPSLEEELAQVLIFNIWGQVLKIPYFGTGVRNSIFWDWCYDTMYSIFWGQVSEWSLLAKVR